MLLKFKEIILFLIYLKKYLTNISILMRFTIKERVKKNKKNTSDKLKLNFKEFLIDFPYF